MIIIKCDILTTEKQFMEVKSAHTVICIQSSDPIFLTHGKNWITSDARIKKVTPEIYENSSIVLKNSLEERLGVDLKLNFGSAETGSKDRDNHSFCPHLYNNAQTPMLVSFSKTK